MLLEGKVVVITGAGPGMGQAMCRGAAREGARVVISSRSAERIVAIRDEILAEGGEAICVTADVSDSAQCRNLAEQALRQWGRIDGLVNAAYLSPIRARLHEASIEDIARAIDVNALGSLRMAQAVIPAMLDQKEGAIVNISTIGTRLPSDGLGGYAVGKAALAQITRHMAKELSGTGIRVNTAAMGRLDGVPLRSHYAAMGEKGEQLRARTISDIPLGRIPPDGDCAKAVYFLLSEYASEITGATLDVNGGEWMTP